MELFHEQVCNCILLYGRQWWLKVPYIIRSSSYTARTIEAEITTDELLGVESENSHATADDLHHMLCKNQFGSSTGMSCVILNICRQSDWGFSGIGTSITIESEKPGMYKEPKNKTPKIRVWTMSKSCQFGWGQEQLAWYISEEWKASSGTSR